jgi:hypothetical protein
MMEGEFPLGFGEQKYESMRGAPMIYSPRRRVPADLYKEALRLVNIARKATRRRALKELPLGIPEHAWKCPIAKALDKGQVSVRLSWYASDRIAYVGFHTAGEAEKVAKAWGAESYQHDPTLVVAPAILRDFVLAFDHPGSKV